MALDRWPLLRRRCRQPGAASVRSCSRSRADFTLDGRVGTEIGLDGQLERVDFDLGGGPGRLTLPDQLPDPLPIRKIAVTGRFDAGLDRLVIDQRSWIWARRRTAARR